MKNVYKAVSVQQVPGIVSYRFFIEKFNQTERVIHDTGVTSNNHGGQKRLTISDNVLRLRAIYQYC